MRQNDILNYYLSGYKPSLAVNGQEGFQYYLQPDIPNVNVYRLKSVLFSGFAQDVAQSQAVSMNLTGGCFAECWMNDWSDGLNQPVARPMVYVSGTGSFTVIMLPFGQQLFFRNLKFRNKLSFVGTMNNGTAAAIYVQYSVLAEVEAEYVTY